MMLLRLFNMYVNRRLLIGWHSVSSNYLDGFYFVTLITRERFHNVSLKVFSLSGCVGLFLKF